MSQMQDGGDCVYLRSLWLPYLLPEVCNEIRHRRKMQAMRANVRHLNQIKRTQLLCPAPRTRATSVMAYSLVSLLPRNQTIMRATQLTDELCCSANVCSSTSKLHTWNVSLMSLCAVRWYVFAVEPEFTFEGSEIAHCNIPFVDLCECHARCDVRFNILSQVRGTATR
jgi:hypothetical protein